MMERILELSLEQRLMQTQDLMEGTLILSSQTQKWHFSLDIKVPVPSTYWEVASHFLLHRKGRTQIFTFRASTDSDQRKLAGRGAIQALSPENNIPTWVLPPLISWLGLKSWFCSHTQGHNFKHLTAHTANAVKNSRDNLAYISWFSRW